MPMDSLPAVPVVPEIRRPTVPGYIAQARDFIAGWELLRTTAYRDSGRVWTIGFGHTGGVKPGQHITPQQARDFLAADVAVCDAALDELVKVRLTDNQRAALLSLTFNIGCGNIARSTLLKRLNEGDCAAAALRFTDWVYVDGAYSRGLARRRLAERDLFRLGGAVAEVPRKP